MATTKREFTAVYTKRGNRYVAWVEEVPGVNTQASTLRELRENLKDALRLVLSANKMLARKALGKDMSREPFSISLSS